MQKTGNIGSTNTAGANMTLVIVMDSECACDIKWVNGMSNTEGKVPNMLGSLIAAPPQSLVARVGVWQVPSCATLALPNLPKQATHTLPVTALASLLHCCHLSWWHRRLPERWQSLVRWQQERRAVGKSCSSQCPLPLRPISLALTPTSRRATWSTSWSACLRRRTPSMLT